MATKEQYAEWCVRLVEGDDYFVDKMYLALKEDGYTDEDGFWIGKDEDDG